MSFCDRVGGCFENVVGAAAFGVISGVGAGTVSWLGYSVTQVSFTAGAGLGAAGTLSTFAASYLLSKISKYDCLNMIASIAVGCATTYGASVAATTLGFIAAPVTVPTAIILTVSGLATLVLVGKCCCPKEKNETKKEKPLSPPPAPPLPGSEAAELEKKRRLEAEKAEESEEEEEVGSDDEKDKDPTSGVNAGAGVNTGSSATASKPESTGAKETPATSSSSSSGTTADTTGAPAAAAAATGASTGTSGSSTTEKEKETEQKVA